MARQGLKPTDHLQRTRRCPPKVFVHHATEDVDKIRIHYQSFRCDMSQLVKPQFMLTVTLGLISGGFVWLSPCEAQVITVPGGPQNPPSQSPLAGQPQTSLPSPGVPANIITSQTTPTLKNNPLSANPGFSLGSAGRGLPGMPGGPSLNAPMGAQDPSPGYMRPPVVGPLFCDPALNVPC